MIDVAVPERVGEVFRMVNGWKRNVKCDQGEVWGGRFE